MGKLVSGSIPNLISGVSQQPSNVRLPTQAEEQVNCYSSVSDFLKRRPALNHIAKIADSEVSKSFDDGSIFIHSINRDEVEKYIVLVTTDDVRVFDLQGNEKTVNIDESAQAYLAKATNPAADFRAQTINDYTFIVNRKVVVKSDEESITEERPPEALVFIKQASYNTTYTVVLDGTLTASFTTLDGVAPSDQPADELSSAQITGALAEAINADDQYTAIAKNSTLWIRKKDNTDFKIEVSDTRSNTHTSLCKGTTQRFSDLLTAAPRDFVTEVVGDASSSFDNYYVRFEPSDENSDFGTGLWKETVKPGIPYKFDASTMPHGLIREADGTFSFKQLEWDERTCGDDDSAPFPSFTDKTINGLFFYRNRLAFLSEDNVVMSETGKFFNFFVTTVTALIDSDVVDVAASNTKSSFLQYAAVFSGGIILFSDQSQFTLEHDTVLSNSTVSVKPVTEFEADMGAAPVSSGKTVFFATARGDWGGVREYITLPDNTDQNDAADVTAHCPRYIPSGIYKLLCSTNEDFLLVFSNKDRKGVWAYKYYWNGNEKIQSSWSRWEMAGQVLGAALFNAEVYFVMYYPGDGLYLEKCSIAPAFKDIGEEFEYCLDRKITETSLTDISYDADEKSTSFTFPYAFAEGEVPMLVTRSAEGQRAGLLFDVLSVSGKKVTVRGDRRNLKLYCGIPYTSTYIFSTLAIRESNNGNAVTTGRLQLRNLTLNCDNTGLLEINVTPSFRQTSKYTFTGREMGHGTNILGDIPLYTGIITAPILTRNTEVEISVTSSSYLPFALVNASWEGFYNVRHQRV